MAGFCSHSDECHAYFFQVYSYIRPTLPSTPRSSRWSLYWIFKSMHILHVLQGITTECGFRKQNFQRLEVKVGT